MYFLNLVVKGFKPLLSHSRLSTENEEDRERAKNLDPRLLFPTKAWVMGFLPGHKFDWDIEDELDEMTVDEQDGVVSREEFHRTARSEISEIRCDFHHVTWLREQVNNV